MSLRFGTSFGNFSPLDFGPAVWLSDTGTNPNQWDDISGNNRHFTGTGSTIISAGPYKRQVRSFNGTTQYLRNAYYPSLANTGRFTVITVSPTTNFVFCGPSGTLLGREYYWNWAILASLGGGSVVTTAWQQYSASIGGVNSSNGGIGSIRRTSNTNIRGRSNGVTINTTIPDLGLRSDNGDMTDYKVNTYGEVLIYPYALTDDQMSLLERYFSVKWGMPVSSSLAPSIRIGWKTSPLVQLTEWWEDGNPIGKVKGTSLGSVPWSVVAGPHGLNAWDVNASFNLASVVNGLGVRPNITHTLAFTIKKYAYGINTYFFQGNGNYYYLVPAYSTPMISLNTNAGGGSYVSFPFDTWNSVVVTYSNAEGLARLYINGQLAQTAIGRTASTSFFGIFQTATNTAQLANFAISLREWTQEDINQFHNNGNFLQYKFIQ